MINYFEKKYGFEGKLFNSEITINNLQCELFVNRLDTISCKAIIIIPPSLFSLVNILLNSRELIKVESTSSVQLIRLEGRYYQLQSSSESGSNLILKIDYCEINNEFNEGKIYKANFTAYIDDTQTFTRRNLIVQHYSKGLLGGWNYNKNKDSESDWDEQEDIINSTIGKLIFMPSFVFAKINDRNYKLVADQQIIQYIVKGKEINLEDHKKRFIEVIKKYLKMITFLEGEKIEWSYINILAFNEEEHPSKEIEIYKRYKPLKRAKEDSSHYYRFYESYQDILPKLVSSYESLAIQQQENFETILRRFIVASTHDKIDTQIIYWHSCLDLIIKWAKVRGKSFTQKLIKACNKKEIDWTDLYPYLTEESVFSDKPAQLKLNEIRNSMIHDGDYLKNYDTAILEMRKAKALSERFLMRILNLDYANNGIGLEHYSP